MNIHWAALGEVLLVGLAAGVGLVTLYALAIRLISPVDAGEPGAVGGGVGAAPATAVPATAAKAVAALLMLCCVAIIAVGIYLIVHK